MAAINWHISEQSFKLLETWLNQNKPKKILELGSGKTSILFTDYAAKHHAQFLSLEHSSFWYIQTRSQLKIKTGVKLAPLKRTEYGIFYNYPLPRGIDFVLIDGPPLSYGRNATFYAIYPYLAKNYTVWLDDVHREHEKQCLKNWQRDFPINLTRIDGRIIQICPTIKE